MYRGAVWFPERCLPDGRHRTESFTAGLLRDEPVHRVDSADGGLAGLAALRGEAAAGPGGGAGGHHLPGVHSRDHQAQHEGRLWLIPPGDISNQMYNVHFYFNFTANFIVYLL